MKIFLIVTHVLLGLVLIFFNINNLLHLVNLATQNSGDQYYYGMSLSQGFVEAILVAILGLLSMVGAFAFKKDKRWAEIVLPVITAVLTISTFFTANNYGGGEGSLAVGPGIFFGLILLLFLVVETIYIFKRGSK